MKKENLGFTLIEMLVVVLIIGILAAIALPQYKIAVGRAKLATIKNTTESIIQAEERYFLANNEYTDDLSVLDIEIPNTVICIFSKTSAYCDTSISGVRVRYANSIGSPWRRVLVISRDKNDIANQVCKQDTGQNAIVPNNVDYIYYNY